jgi:hypothetical protein
MPLTGHMNMRKVNQIKLLAMKKGILIILIAFLYLSCKKDGGSGKPLYLSKVFTNDLLSEEYIYSTDKKAVRRNKYSTGGGQSNFAGFRIYEYENDLMNRMLQYNKEGNLINKMTFLYDGLKKVTRFDIFGNDESLDWYYMFEYDNNQQLSKMTGYSPNPVKKQGEWLFQYNEQSNLVSMKRYYFSNGTPVLSDSAVFTYADKTMPAHWQFYEELMYDFPTERTLESILATSFYYHNLAVGPIKTTHTFTQKTYNGQGYLVSQQYKLDADAGLGTTTTTNYNLKYEYIE